MNISSGMVGQKVVVSSYNEDVVNLGWIAELPIDEIRD